MADPCVTARSSQQHDSRDDFVHAIGNQIGIVLGLLELMLEDTPPDDARHRDLLDAKRAASNAAALLTAQSGVEQEP